MMLVMENLDLVLWGFYESSSFYILAIICLICTAICVAGGYYAAAGKHYKFVMLASLFAFIAFIVPGVIAMLILSGSEDEFSN
jgi:hypothetical protein